MQNTTEQIFFKGLRNTQQVLFAATYAHINNDITLVGGDAGAGKTTALKYYTQNNTGVIYITANACSSLPIAVLSLICEQLGIHAPNRKDQLMKSLVSKLKDSKKLIIIDEADHLTLPALQAIRNLNDVAHVGIVLAGNDKIYRQMLSGRRGYEFDQIRTRIIVRKKVCNDYTVDEIREIFPNLNNECLGQLLKLACNESLRTSKKIFDFAIDLAEAKGEKINIKHLKSTQNQLFEEAIY